LEETESKLEIISSEDIPEFKSEETDKDSIVSYLNDTSKLIDDSIKGIEIISSGQKSLLEPENRNKKLSAK